MMILKWNIWIEEKKEEIKEEFLIEAKMILTLQALGIVNRNNLEFTYHDLDCFLEVFLSLTLYSVARVVPAIVVIISIEEGEYIRDPQG